MVDMTNLVTQTKLLVHGPLHQHQHQQVVNTISNSNQVISNQQLMVKLQVIRHGQLHSKGKSLSGLQKNFLLSGNLMASAENFL